MNILAVSGEKRAGASSLWVSEVKKRSSSRRLDVNAYKY